MRKIALTFPGRDSRDRISHPTTPSTPVISSVLSISQAESCTQKARVAPYSRNPKGFLSSSLNLRFLYALSHPSMDWPLGSAVRGRLADGPRRTGQAMAWWL